MKHKTFSSLPLRLIPHNALQLSLVNKLVCILYSRKEFVRRDAGGEDDTFLKKIISAEI